jgi:excisionase family DNA binding protein
MNPIELNLRLTVDEANIRTIVDVLRQAFHVDIEYDDGADARMKASRNAQFAGKKSPEDRGLLIDVNEVAKLLNVSARHVYRMDEAGAIPKAIRIGAAVRWSLDEIRNWIAAGCPSAKQSKL